MMGPTLILMPEIILYAAASVFPSNDKHLACILNGGASRCFLLLRC